MGKGKDDFDSFLEEVKATVLIIKMRLGDDLKQARFEYSDDSDYYSRADYLEIEAKKEAFLKLTKLVKHYFKF